MSSEEDLAVSPGALGGVACKPVRDFFSASTAARRAAGRAFATRRARCSPRPRGRRPIFMSISTAAIAAVRAQVEAVCAKAGLAAADRARLALGLGLAGLSSAEDAKRVEARFEGLAGVRAANDAVTACLGAHGGADGALVIAGTGSAAIARVRGRETVIGGRGFLLGDDGSAARVGVDAVRAALRALRRARPDFADDAGSHAALSRRSSRARSNGRSAPSRRATAPSRRWSSSAPRRETKSRWRSSRAAARAVDALIRAAQALGAERVALVGGLSEPIRPYLATPSQAALRRAVVRRRRRRNPVGGRGSARERRRQDMSGASGRASLLSARACSTAKRCARIARSSSRTAWFEGSRRSPSVRAAARNTISAAAFSRPASSIGRSTAAAACCSTRRRPPRRSARSPPLIGTKARPRSCRR